MLELLKRRLRLRSMPGQFRSNVWDPSLIISQIVCLQCFYYVSLGAWAYVLDKTQSQDVAIDQLFNPNDLGLYEDTGICNLIAFALNSLTCSLGLWFIVRRTKQCLDFAATSHLVHLVACWIMSGHFPRTLWWWLTNLICLTLMTVLGEFLCMRTEMKAIPVSIGPKVDL